MPDEQRVFNKRRGKALTTAEPKRSECLPHTAALAVLVKDPSGAESCPCPPEAVAVLSPGKSS